jgi:isoquinoline 1-oxidoreductase subunit beta
MKRRHFLIAGAGATAALVVGWALLPSGGAVSRLGAPSKLPVANGELALNGWIKLTPQGKLCAMIPRSEMGQGVYTSLPTLLAEEIGIPLESISIEYAPLGGAQDAIYGNTAMLVGGLPFHPNTVEEGGAMLRFAQSQTTKLAHQLSLVATGGSSSVADAWEPMRLAGAACRETLKAAAAAQLGVEASAVKLSADGCEANGKRVSFLDMVKVNADFSKFLPDVKTLKLKEPKDFTQIGQALPRKDVPAKVNGSAMFGMDVRIPGMVYAAVKMCPTLGGSIATIDSKAAEALTGVQGVYPIAAHAGGTAGVAVVGKTYWHAKEALQALKIVWTDGPLRDFESNAWLDKLSLTAKPESSESGFSFHSRGDVEAAFKAAVKTVSTDYRAPFLAHATMEPINCTAQFKDAKLELWVGTQVPSIARNRAAKTLGLDASAVKINVQYLGGGFGRRLELDFILQAAELAKLVAPKAVQMIWSREEDITHDFYRPAQAASLQAALDMKGNVTAWRVKSAGGAIMPQVLPRAFGIPGGGPDKTTSEGMFDIPYSFASQSIRHVALDPGVPIGFWRSVGHSMNAFFSETFIDEVAVAAGAEPAAFRLKYLDTAPRHKAVLQLALDKAAYGKPLPEGHAHGVALCESFGSIVAEVAEVSLQDGKPRVHKVTVAIDCGIAVNPGIIAQQMESSVVFGLSAALAQRIDIKAGQVQQNNFPNYPILTLAQAPQVDTHIIASTRAPTGVGEPGTPPIAPAVANALRKLTKKRYSELPLFV